MRERQIATFLVVPLSVLALAYVLWYQAYSSSYAAWFDSAAAFVYVFYAVPALRFLAGAAIGAIASRSFPVFRLSLKGALILSLLALLPLALRLLPDEWCVLVYELLTKRVFVWLPSAVGAVLGMSGATKGK